MIEVSVRFVCDWLICVHRRQVALFFLELRELFENVDLRLRRILFRINPQVLPSDQFLV